MKQFLLAISLLFSFGALADHHGHGKHMGGPMKEPTKEERATMATMHTAMAECLKTEKPMADCHKAMMDSCPMAKEGKQCPMMAMGMHHGHMMKEKGMMKGKDKAKKTE